MENFYKNKITKLHTIHQNLTSSVYLCKILIKDDATISMVNNLFNINISENKYGKEFPLILKKVYFHTKKRRPNNNIIKREKDTYEIIQSMRDKEKDISGNTTRLFNYFETDKAAYFFIDYFPGEHIPLIKSIESTCQKECSMLILDVHRKIKIIFKTVICLHEQGICHNDLKPDNILFSTGGEPFLTDFGNSIFMKDIVVGDRIFNKDTVTSSGTIQYVNIAFSQLGVEEKYRNDFYAFGLVMFWMLTGKDFVELEDDKFQFATLLVYTKEKRIQKLSQACSLFIATSKMSDKNAARIKKIFEIIHYLLICEGYREFDVMGKLNKLI